MKIAVDAAGGDYAPLEIVKGALEAAAGQNIEIILLGDQPAIEALLDENKLTANITVIHTQQHISCDENPVHAVRSKPDSAIVRGIDLLKQGKADAFVSAGNTGAVLGASYFNLKTLEDIERPALGVLIPLGNPFLLIDGGANTDCQARFLVQFAQLGDIFARRFMGIDSPRIGLLNNGEEPAKGSVLTRETYRLLRDSGLNFAGNIEGQDVFRGKMDVLVTDGFTGNVFLKTIEGCGEILRSLFKDTASSFAVHGDNGNNPLIKKLDFSEYGGSCLLGVNGTVIVSHGRSNAKAMKNAVLFAYRAAASDVVGAIRDGLRPGATS
jgi:glycerol-3-phosphate acyltransferase PlsX